jgi:glycosyltransferase involved in cell wall biosynthesis
MRRRGTIRMPVASRRRFVSGMTQAFLQPDNKIGWKRFALKRAAELIERQSFDAILSTAPPFTDFLIGRELQKRYDLPLVIDYRDPWLDNRDYFYVTPLHRSYAGRMEEMVLKNAESVVVVNRRIKEQLIARYPFLTHETVHILPSGYDAQDFRLAARHPIQRPHKLRITYSGVPDIHRSPKSFFQALSRVFAQYPESRDGIEICFVGTFQEKYRALATSLGVASAIVTTGYLEHLEAVRHLVSSDVLWLTTADPAITPGKIHEYIGTRKPILALVPDGVIKQVLADYGAATIVDPDDIDAIASAIHDLYTKWQNHSLPVGREEAAREYEQRRVTERLARILAHAVKI